MNQAARVSNFIPTPLQAQTSYEGDAFQRERIGQRLTRLVDGFTEGGVIGIDGRWGEGKSWLAMHWSNSIEANYTVVRLNAFESEFDNDPFASIAQAMYEVLKKKPDVHGTSTKVFTALGKAGMVASVTLAKGVLNAATFGASDAVFDQVSKAAEEGLDKVGELGEKHLDDWLSAAERRRNALSSLKTAVQSFVEAQESKKPVVIVIDELDRCLPTYALRMLDVLKHLFDMPGLVFALFINRDQIEAMVASQFGQKVGDGYLGKFVHAWVPLRHDSDVSGHSAVNAIRSLLSNFAKRTRLGDPNRGNWGDFFDFLAWVGAGLDMNARDVERLITLIASMSNIAQARSNRLFSWLLLLKVKHPQVYADIVQALPSGHTDAASLAARVVARYTETPYRAVIEKLKNTHDVLSKDRSDPQSLASASMKGTDLSSATEAIQHFSHFVDIIES